MSKELLVTSHLDDGEFRRLVEIVSPRFQVVYRPYLIPAPRFRGDHLGAPFVRTPIQQREWNGLLQNAEILWDLPHQDQDVEVFANLKALRWVQTTNASVDAQVSNLRVPPEAIVTTAQGIHGEPLAEFVILSLLFHFRGVGQLLEEQKLQRWVRKSGDEMRGKTVAILGAGSLALATAKLAQAHGMTILTVTRQPNRHRMWTSVRGEFFGLEDFHTVLPRADALVVTLPETPETLGIIDAKVLHSLKFGSALVNIARGGLINQEDLISALESGQVGFAALDVATPEPLPPNDPLWSAKNLLISPHSAAFVYSETNRILDIFEANFRKWVDGRYAEMLNRHDRPGQTFG